MASNARGHNPLPLTPSETVLYQQLIEQFYKISVNQYGPNSDQARTISQLLSAAEAADGRDEASLLYL